jgi:hypothetical protein
MYQKKRTVRKGLTGGNAGIHGGIEKHRLTEARDYIFKVLGYRVESQYNPYKYEYIDLSKPLPRRDSDENISLPLKRDSMKNVSLLVDDIY